MIVPGAVSAHPSRAKAQTSPTTVVPPGSREQLMENVIPEGPQAQDDDIDQNPPAASDDDIDRDQPASSDDDDATGGQPSAGGGSR